MDNKLKDNEDVLENEGVEGGGCGKGEGDFGKVDNAGVVGVAGVGGDVVAVSVSNDVEEEDVDGAVLVLADSEDAYGLEGSYDEERMKGLSGSVDDVHKRRIYSRRVMNNWFAKASLLKGWKILAPCFFVKKSPPEALIEQDERITADQIKIIKARVREDVEQAFALAEFENVDFCRGQTEENDAGLSRRLERGRVFSEEVRRHVVDGNMKKVDAVFFSPKNIFSNPGMKNLLGEKRIKDLAEGFEMSLPYVRDVMFGAIESALASGDARALVELAGSKIWTELDFSEVDILYWNEICEKALDGNLRFGLVDEFCKVFKGHGGFDSFVRAKWNLESVGLLDSEDFIMHGRFMESVYRRIGQVISYGILFSLFDCEVEDFIAKYESHYRLIMENSGYSELEVVDFCVEAYRWME